MAAPMTERQLRQLQEGDRLTYHGIQWHVTDASTYTDVNGYETEEWLLKSQTGKQYYLMREVDPQNPEGLVHWYIAEELRNPIIYEGGSTQEVTYTVADAMRSHRPPYPELRVFNRTYQFESQTEGEYEADGERCTRITWDYWDPPHLWNLALEAWSNGQLSVYSTREVQPTDFTEIPVGLAGVSRNRSLAAVSQTSSLPYVFTVDAARYWKMGIAWVITTVGFILMILGI